MTRLRKLSMLLLLLPCLAHSQGRAGGGRQQATVTPAAAAPAPNAALGRDFVRENYTRFEYRIPMRDGVKLFTSIYIPKTFSPTSAPTPC